MCESHAPIKESVGDWPSMGVSLIADRYQRRPGLSAADVPKLKLKWSFTMPGGGQPTVVGDWLFVTNRSGKFYALDAKSGCVHWAVADSGSRTTPMIVRSSISPSGWATFIGVTGRIVRAFDAQTGKAIWQSEVLDPNPVAALTGTPVIVGDKLFVPLSSGEEGAATQPSYPCCSFRGSVAALDVRTGRTLWQTPVITEPLRPTRKNKIGTQLQGPAGAAIWAAPSVDVKRGLVYVVTGDSYTDAETDRSDAVMAIDMNTGKIRWSHQATAGDNFIVGCEVERDPTNCPLEHGPDFDFGATPILFTLKNGKQILVAGQKSGLVYGFNPDDGKLLWMQRVGSGSVIGGVEWGIGADDRHIFVPNSDADLLFDEIRRKLGKATSTTPDVVAKPGLSALDPATGKIVWHTPAPIAPCNYFGDRSRDRSPGGCVRAQSAAPAVIPGIVFSGTLDGWMRAYDANTGKIVWEYSTTAQTYDTVNGIKGQPGGGIDGMGPTIAHGMVYTMSGFNGASRTGSNGNNVLLAFSVDGK
jgi:polyvinyl alcohol dehydrogenase (cytochrome)